MKLKGVLLPETLDIPQYWPRTIANIETILSPLLETTKDETRTHYLLRESPGSRSVSWFPVSLSPETFPACWTGRGEETRKSSNTRRNNNIVFFGWICARMECVFPMYLVKKIIN